MILEGTNDLKWALWATKNVSGLSFLRDALERGGTFALEDSFKELERASTGLEVLRIEFDFSPEGGARRCLREDNPQTSSLTGTPKELGFSIDITRMDPVIRVFVSKLSDFVRTWAQTKGFFDEQGRVIVPLNQKTLIVQEVSA